MSEWAKCDECGRQLDYQVGSIVWRCVGNPHLCPSCHGKKSADETIALFKALLKERTRA